MDVNSTRTHSVTAPPGATDGPAGSEAGGARRTAGGAVTHEDWMDAFFGVEVTFDTLESAAWTERWRSRQWEALVSAWFLPADPSITGLYLCDGPNNMTGFCHPELDELMVMSDGFLDFARRKPWLDQAQVALAETARMLPIYYGVMPEVVSESVGGYQGSGTNFGSFWNLWEWTLDD